MCRKYTALYCLLRHLTKLYTDHEMINNLIDDYYKFYQYEQPNHLKYL